MVRVPAPNTQVRFRKRVGSRYLTTELQDVVVVPASQYALTDPTASRYRYAIHWDDELRFEDPRTGERYPVSMGDFVLWHQYEGQQLALAEPLVTPVAATTTAVVMSYFMALPGEASGGQ